MSAVARLFGSSTFKSSTRRSGVMRSMEFCRVHSLPRRILETGDEAEQLALALTAYLRRPEGEMTLKTLQALMLIEAKDHNSLFSTAPVGSGKSVAAALFPVVMESKNAVIISLATVKHELEHVVIPMVFKNFKRHNGIITVLSYHDLSSDAGVDLLHELDPDLIVFDEVHCLKNKNAARTVRVLNFLKKKPKCRVVMMSGTVTSNSLKEFAHLLYLTHPHDTPLPREWKELEEWARAVDPELRDNSKRILAGALKDLCVKGESAAMGVGRRIRETHGVVAGNADALGISLFMERVDGPLARGNWLADVNKLRTEWETKHEVLADGAKVAAKLKELSHGFYYRWVWPKGKVDVDWMEARLAWAKYSRSVAKRRIHGLDTEKRIRDAVRNWDASDLPRSMVEEGTLTLAAWDEQNHKKYPPKEAVWLSYDVVDYAARWVATHPRGIVWYRHHAFGDALRARGVPTFGSGKADASALLELSEGDFKKDPGGIACSFAHCTGKNLQRWNENLFLVPLTSGMIFEQTIARTHRPKQPADEVRCEMLFTLNEADDWFLKALKQATYIQEVQGAPQKLLTAQFIGLDDYSAMRLQKSLDATESDMVLDEDEEMNELGE